MVLMSSTTVDLNSTDLAAWFGFLAILAMTLWAVWRARGRRENIWVEPSSLFMLFYFFRYGIGCLTINYWDQIPFNTPGLDKAMLVSKHNLVYGSFLTVVGGLGLLAGTLIPALPTRSILPAIRWQISWPRFWQHSLIFLPVTIVLLLMVSLRPHLIPLSVRYIVLLIAEVGGIVACVGIIRYLDSGSSMQRKWLLLSLTFIFLSALIGVPVGMRGNVLKPFFLLFIAYTALRGRLPKKALLLLLPLVVFIVFPWLTLVKEARFSPNPVSRVEYATQELGQMSTRDKLELASWTFVGRFMAGPSLISRFSNFYPQVIPYAGWKPLRISLEMNLPRLLFPSKGNPGALLNEYSRRVGIIGERDYVTSAVFDAISGYYIMFGPISLFLFCVLQGYLFRVLYDWLVVRSFWVFGVVIYLYFFWSSPDFSAIFVQVPSLIRYLMISIPICYFLSRSNAGGVSGHPSTPNIT
jgi:hypothetical protein